MLNNRSDKVTCIGAATEILCRCWECLHKSLAHEEKNLLLTSRLLISQLLSFNFYYKVEISLTFYIYYILFFIKSPKRTDNASERIVLRGGGGVFQEKNRRKRGESDKSAPCRHEITRNFTVSAADLLYSASVLSEFAEIWLDRKIAAEHWREAGIFACLRSFLSEHHMIGEKSKIFFKYYAASNCFRLFHALSYKYHIKKERKPCALF